MGEWQAIEGINGKEYVPTTDADRALLQTLDEETVRLEVENQELRSILADLWEAIQSDGGEFSDELMDRVRRATTGEAARGAV